MKKKNQNKIFSKIKLSHVIDLIPEFILLLFVIFLILKLNDNIDWNWVWILSPIWVPIVLFGGLYLLCFVTRKTHY
jgi:membrane protein required for beta-lactamase induction